MGRGVKLTSQRATTRDVERNPNRCTANEQVRTVRVLKNTFLLVNSELGLKVMNTLRLIISNAFVSNCFCQCIIVLLITAC